MTVSLVRIDDRMIHGLITTRWAKEVPCDGIIAVNDKAHDNPILKETYKSAAEGQGKKCFVWTMDHFNKVKARRSSKLFSCINTYINIQVAKQST